MRALYSGLQKSVNGLVSSNIGHCQLRMSGIVKALLNSYRSDPIHILNTLYILYRSNPILILLYILYRSDPILILYIELMVGRISIFH